MSSLSSEILEYIDQVLKNNLVPIKQQLEELLKQKVKEVGQFTQFANGNYEKFVKQLERQDSQLMELCNESKILKSTIHQIEQKLSNLGDKLNDLEQYGRRDCVEIHGIPFSQDEDTNDIVIKVGELIGVTIEEDDISVSHRLPVSYKYKGVRANPSIIVKFVRRDFKEQFYSSRKELRGFSTEDLGYSATNNIYINESLTERNKGLFKEALKAKKSLKYKFIWTSNGKVYLRKDTDTKIIHIKNSDDIKRLLSR